MMDVPFDVVEVGSGDKEAERLFRRAFRSPAPDYPRHFVALQRQSSGRRAAGYIHFTVFEPGVFLCGGLCVDSAVYRRLAVEERRALAERGSLSRWLSERSIAALGPKRAVFAYTGDQRSRRDAFALGFSPTAGPHLLVQWHDEPQSVRPDLVAKVSAIGPF